MLERNKFKSFDRGNLLDKSNVLIPPEFYEKTKQVVEIPSEERSQLVSMFATGRFSNRKTRRL